MKSAPLFLQAVGLTLATLIAGLAVTTVVVLFLPSQRPDIYTLTEVAQVVRTGHPVAAHDGQTIEVARNASSPPRLVPRHLRFRNALAQLLGRDSGDIIVDQREPRLVAFAPGERQRNPPPFARDQPLLFGPFQVWIRQPGGAWTMVAPRHPLIESWQGQILLALVLSALAVTPLAWIYSRRIAAPIAALAVAAERLGRDPDAPSVEVKGSREVEVAATAFNQMQLRLRRHMADRTAMMAAIAHDLRTPLTRLRFRIEDTPDDLRARLAADIDEMEAIVAAAQALVRDIAGPRDRSRLELASMLLTVVDAVAETGADAVVDRADPVVVGADQVALRRLVTNLVDNALKFGARARCRVYAEAGSAILEVDDDGPGIPEPDIETAFEPFRRLEGSRNRGTGGSGLGLAVVRAVARGHDGEVTLRNRPEGGLRARLSLPLAV